MQHTICLALGVAVLTVLSGGNVAGQTITTCVRDESWKFCEVRPYQKAKVPQPDRRRKLEFPQRPKG